MRRMGRAGRKRGYSFVEVLFGVALTGALATIVAAAMPVATMSRTKADAANHAQALAQKEMEAARGLGYANLTGAQLFANGLVDDANGTAAGAWAFTNVDAGMSDSPGTALAQGTGLILVDQADVELRRVTVQVTWRERGATRSYTLSTLVANL